jgi:phosphoribosylamine--glycine ligase
LTRSEYDEAVAIVQAIVDALRNDGSPYVGAIYGQFMLTLAGPKVIEVNARFGDPEAMNVLHLLETDYVLLLQSMVAGELHKRKLAFRPHATVVKYAVPKGYGEDTPRKGAPVHVDKEALEGSGATVYFASIQEGDDGALETLASRTLAVLGEAETISEAERIAEEGLEAIESDALYVRHDIGTNEIIERRIRHMRELRSAQGATDAKQEAEAPTREED